MSYLKLDHASSGRGPRHGQNSRDLIVLALNLPSAVRLHGKHVVVVKEDIVVEPVRPVHAHVTHDRLPAPTDDRVGRNDDERAVRVEGDARRVVVEDETSGVADVPRDVVDLQQDGIQPWLRGRQRHNYVIGGASGQRGGDQGVFLV